MNVLSILVGLFALLWALVAFVPFLGWMYWLVIPLALVGFVLGTLSSHRSGRNLNLVVIVVGALRLMLGHGIF